MKVQTERDPTGDSPPLETDPRRQCCEKHRVFLYPGELCHECLSDDLDDRAALLDIRKRGP